jgi:hypothetical protein
MDNTKKFSEWKDLERLPFMKKITGGWNNSKWNPRNNSCNWGRCFKKNPRLTHFVVGFVTGGIQRSQEKYPQKQVDGMIKMLDDQRVVMKIYLLLSGRKRHLKHSENVLFKLGIVYPCKQQREWEKTHPMLMPAIFYFEQYRFGDKRLHILFFPVWVKCSLCV